MYCLTMWRDSTKQSLHSDNDETSSDELRFRLIIIITITITKQLNSDMLDDVKGFLTRLMDQLIFYSFLKLISQINIMSNGG